MRSDLPTQTRWVQPPPDPTVLPAVAEAPAPLDVLGALGNLPHTSLLLVDAQLRFQAVVGSALSRHGYPVEALKGQRVADALPAVLVKRVLTHLATALLGTESRDDSPWGEGGQEETTYTPVRSADGAVVAALAVVRDVSAERTPFDAMVEAGDDLLSAAFHGATAGLALVTTEGRLVRANPAMGRLLGRDDRELPGAGLAAVLGAQVAEVLRAGTGALLDGGPALELDASLARPDGSRMLALLHLSLGRGSGTEPALLVLQAQDVTERALAHEDLRRRAQTDPLTGLPNRAVLFDRLGQALAAARRRRAQVAVVFVDLDAFKQVNDSMGHAVGDDVLRTVARRLRDAVREEDTVARLGGDEFVVLVEAVEDEDQLQTLVRRLHASVEEPVDVPGGRVRVGLTTGLVVGSGMTAEEMLRRADQAMYAGKPQRVLDLR